MFMGVKEFNPIIRVNATRSGSGPRFTRLPTSGDVRAVALRRTLRLFGLPHRINRFRNAAMAVKDNHFNPCMLRSHGCMSVPGRVSPVTVALRRTIRLVGRGHSGRRGHRVGAFRRSGGLRLLGKHCNPCVTFSNGGCHVPGTGRRGMRSLDCRRYVAVVGRTPRPGTENEEDGGRWGRICRRR